MHQSERIISNPNLPENAVTCVAIGSKYNKTANSFINRNIRIIGLECNLLPNYLSGHADMQLFHFGNNIIFNNEISAGESFLDFKTEIIPEVLKSDYPDDCLLNCVRIGNKLICNKNSVSKSILKLAEESGLTIIEVKQGYTKCSVCILNENAIITDDESVYKSAQNFFNDTLLISKGSIRLQTKEYGFIGGATGKLDKNILAFNGRIESHTDHNKIYDILYKYNITADELLDEPLEDIGSIIPLIEKRT